MKRVIGVTGGISSGKSNVCKVLRELGYPVIDSDKISYDLSKKGNSVYEAILESFGPEYLLPDGELDRKKLGRLIFNNPDAKRKLNSVTHPLIVSEMEREIGLIPDGLIFAEIPLLYEAHLEGLCDKVICIYLEEEIQIRRLMEREGIDYEYARAKVHSQMDLNDKRNRSDYVINSRGTFDETKEQVLSIIKEIKGV